MYVKFIEMYVKVIEMYVKVIDRKELTRGYRSSLHQDLQFIRHLYVKDGDLHVLLYYLTYQSTWLNIIIAKWLK